MEKYGKVWENDDSPEDLGIPNLQANPKSRVWILVCIYITSTMAIGNFARLDDFFVLFLGIDFAQPIQNRIVAGPADQERCWVAQLEDLR